MHKIDDWPGKREETQIEYEIFSEHSACVKTAHDKARSFNVLTDRSYTSTDELIKADKSDCLVAASIGVLIGLLDVFWLGELSISDAQT